MEIYIHFLLSIFQFEDHCSLIDCRLQILIGQSGVQLSLFAESTQFLKYNKGTEHMADKDIMCNLIHHSALILSIGSLIVLKIYYFQNCFFSHHYDFSFLVALKCASTYFSLCLRKCSQSAFVDLVFHIPIT